MHLTKFSPLTLLSLFLLMLPIGVFFTLTSPATTAAQKVRSLAFTAQQGQGATFRGSLFTIQANGKARRDLTPTLKDVYPTLTWSPNGGRVAFVSGETDIYVVNADGSGLTKLLAEDFCKASSFDMVWSSNSQKLAIARSCDGSSSDTPGSQSLYASDTTGMKGTKLTQRWQVGGMQPKTDISSGLYFSPDGQQVAFVKDQEIYKMNVDGSSLAKVNASSQNTRNQSPNWSELSWSPDGTRIARIDFFYEKERQEQTIYLLDAAGKVLAQVTSSATNWSRPNLAWSPNGTRVAYYQSQPDLSQVDIYLLNVSGGTPRNLTQKPGQYLALHWLPNSKQLAFVADGKIYTINVDGSNLAQIPIRLPVSGISAPAWSADSQQIAFSSGEAGKDNLYVVNRDGSGLTKLTDAKDVGAYSPTWQP
jgi:Tol biopolymer transport system component